MSAGTSKTLVIIDEQFEKIDGHPYEYNKSVAQIFRQNGFDVNIFAHENLPQALQLELGARAYFSFKTQSAVRKIPVLGNFIYRYTFWKKYVSEFKALLVELKPDDNYLFFFPNVYWYNILPISQSLKDIHLKAALLFRISIFDALRLPAFMKPVTLRIIKAAVKNLRHKKNICYYSDSEVIAAEWLEHLHANMGVLPIPHLVQHTGTAPAGTGKIRMYLPGGMRMEKGAQMLTEAFEHLAASQPETLKHITLVTQFTGNDIQLNGYKSRLAALPVENEFLGHLSTEAYNGQMAKANIILIPYQVSEGYRARTSGILAETIAMSKPFITTDGTWMSVQARKFDTGLIVTDNQPAELADAICAMINAYENYSLKAGKACAAWAEAHSKEAFYKQLMSCFNVK